jgi:hypothetical protein
MMYSLESMGRTTPIEPAPMKAAAPQNSQESFLQHLAESGEESSTANLPATGSTAERQNSGAPRRNTGAQSAGATAADALGLISTLGARATINGQTFYGTENGWSASPPESGALEAGALDTAQASPSKGEEMLGFRFQWVGEVTSVTVNENAQAAGTVQLNKKMYATEETAKKLAEVLGATAAPCDGVDYNGQALATQWELEFGNGTKLNAGLVADMFLRDPERALARMRAEIGV